MSSASHVSGRSTPRLLDRAWARRGGWLLALYCGAVFFWNLGAAPLIDVDEDEDGRLTFDDLFKEVGMLAVTRRKFGQLVRELEQQLQSIPNLEVEKICLDLGQVLGQITHWSEPALLRADYFAGTAPGSLPLTMGTRTAEPPSVHEPS